MAAKLIRVLNQNIPNQLFINGQFVNSVHKQTMKVINPATEELITETQSATIDDMNLAIQAAKEAFNGPWRQFTIQDRQNLLLKVAHLIDKNSERINQLDVLNNGMTISHASFMSAGLGAKYFNFMGRNSGQQYGKTLPQISNQLCYTRFEPIGVVGLLTPWNFPFLMAASKISTALAAGATMVLKPSELTPLSALLLGQILNEAGLPKGVVNIVPSDDIQVAKHLTMSKDVRKLSFTGSTNTGKQILQAAGVNNLKKVSLELGGKSPSIVLDDADIDQAVQMAIGSVYFNSGQACIAGSRIFVQEAVFDEFVDKAVKIAKNRIVGDPFDPKTQQGPLISEAQLAKVQNYIKQGIEQGAECLFGGQRLDRKGFFIEPSVFVNCNDEQTFIKEEVFGPVATIMKFSSTDEVIDRANNTCYGLSGGIFTKNIDKAFKLANKIEAGMLFINSYGADTFGMPFGGIKDSGFGREQCVESIREYMEQKTVIIQTTED